MDIVWCIVMKWVWASKPPKNATTWAAFDNIRSFTLLLSFVNIVLKAAAIWLLLIIYRGGKGK